MVLKQVNLVHNTKIRSNGLERSQLGPQCKKQVISPSKETIGYTMPKSGHMVMKGINYVHNDKFSQMGLKEVSWVHNDKLGQMVLKGVN